MDVKNYRVKSNRCYGDDKYQFRGNAHAHDQAVIPITESYDSLNARR